MKPSGRTLYQFAISHYSEKTRWNLDAKGLAYRVHDLVPGPHGRVIRRLTKGATHSVPVLVEDGTVIHDSTDIALYLERTHPATPALIPATGGERERVLELEAYFDETAGKHVRRFVYAQLLAEKVDFSPLMFSPFSAPVRLLGRALMPLMRLGIHRQYVRSPAQVEASRVKLHEGLDRLEQEIQGDPARYLVGQSLSIADIAAAALYAPLMGTPGSPYAPRPGERVPQVLAQLRAELLARPVGQWFVRRYQEDRRRQAHGFATGTEPENG